LLGLTTGTERRPGSVRSCGRRPPSAIPKRDLPCRRRYVAANIGLATD